MTAIEPLGTRVLIRPLEEDLKTSSGLYLPETAREKPQRGAVEAVGDPEETRRCATGQVLRPLAVRRDAQAAIY